MTDPVQQLVEVLQAEMGAQQELAAVLDGKLDAMRHYDLPRLEALSRSEQRLMEGLRLHEVRRTDAVRRAAWKVLGPGPTGPVTARQLAQASPEPARTKLLAVAAMLGEVVQMVQRLHRINTVAAQKVLMHFEHVFRIIAQSGWDIGLYGKGGKKAFLQQRRLVDATA